MRKFTPADSWFLIKTTGANFMENNPFRLSAALAYNTIFSLPPILLIVVTAAGFFLGEEAVSGKLYEQLNGVLGAKAAGEVQTMVKGASMDKSGTAAIIGALTLIFAATTFFITLQESLNDIWDVRPRPENGILKTLRDRLLSFGLLISLALLMLVSFAISAGMAILSDYLREMIPGAGRIFLQIGGTLVSVGIIVLVFALVYKFLPDAIIRWRDVWVGAIITAFLFVLGKFLIGFYVTTTDVAGAYGAAGSLIILLVWIYYSSLLVFFGAELTQTWANNFGEKIKPKSSAVKIIKKELTEEEAAREQTGRPPSEGRFNT